MHGGRAGATRVAAGAACALVAALGPGAGARPATSARLPLARGPSLAAAKAYLTRRNLLVLLQYNGMRARPSGFALYFTVVSVGSRSGVVVKLCENAYGRVTGSSNLSAGEPSC
jgi:hypothetical protein